MQLEAGGGQKLKHIPREPADSHEVDSATSYPSLIRYILTVPSNAMKLSKDTQPSYARSGSGKEEGEEETLHCWQHWRIFLPSGVA